MIQRNEVIHSHFTRLAINIRRTIFRTKKAQNSIYSSAIIEFNTLPQEMKEETNLIALKNKLKIYFLNKDN